MGAKIWSVMRGACLILAILCVTIASSQSERTRAGTLYEQRDFEGAASALRLHLEEKPEDRDARILLGICLYQLKRHNEAEQVFRESIRRRTVDAQAHYYLALVEHLQGKLLESEANARHSIVLGGNAARSLHLIGKSREERNLLEDALDFYQQALARDATNADARISAGRVCLKLNLVSEALAHLRRAPKDNAEAAYELGRALLQAGDPSGSRERLQTAARLGHEGAQRLLHRVRTTAVNPAPRQGAPTPVKFRDMAEEAGLHFVLNNHATPEKHLIETMAGGLAVFDYNNDGRIDIFFTNGAETPSLQKASPRFYNRLFRNDGDLKFSDVTAETSLQGTGFSIGAASADFDNDGHVDLFVAGMPVNTLYRNLGGKFRDVTAEAGIKSEAWSVAGGWFDYDKDGWLDLFVVNYLDWKPDDDRYCGDRAANIRTYCHPSFYKGTSNRLYRNRRDGTFEDVSAASGIAAHTGKGMSVAFADYDRDGWLDVFVTNDRLPNFLFRNRGDKTFEEVGMQAGPALTDNGEAVSAMGVDFRDYNNDGLPDLIFTALSGETFPLFRNQGAGTFHERTWPDGIGKLSGRRSGWHVSLADFNNDGWKDVFTANSHVTDNIELLSTVERYREPNSIWLNAGGVFVAGLELGTRRAHRGGATADFDNDGRLDAVVSSLGGPAELWHNVSAGRAHWIRFELEGKTSNRDAIGAEIRVGSQTNTLTTSAGYASGTRTGVHFGLADAVPPLTAEILWPSGIRQRLQVVDLDRTVRVTEPNIRK